MKTQEQEHDVELVVGGKERVKVGMISEDYKMNTYNNKQFVVPIYDERTHDYIAARARKRVRRKFECSILISGARRTGKSTNAVKIARRIDKDLPVDNVAFRLADYAEVLKNLDRADPEGGWFPTAVLDEAGVDAYNKDWQKRAVKELVKVTQISGAKNLCTIMCVPHRMLLATDIREFQQLWVFTRTVGDEERGFAELRECIESPWYVSSFWKPMCGYIFSECDDDWWNNYERKKMRFIDDYISDFNREETPSKMQEQRDLLLKKYCKDVPLENLTRDLGLSRSRVSTLRNATREDVKLHSSTRE